MKLVASALLAASAAIVAAPIASAQDYRTCEEDRRDRQVAGAIVGGLLGVVIGNEIGDDLANDRRGGSRWDRGRGHRGYGHRGRGRGRGYRHRDANDDDAAIIAGAGLGAVIGAGIAGGNDDCRTYHERAYQGQYDYNDQYGHDDYGYDRNGYAYDDRELAGGSDARYGAGNNYGQGQAYQAGYDWNCEWRPTRVRLTNGQIATRDLYMCEGADGIWRPVDAYQ